MFKGMVAPALWIVGAIGTALTAQWVWTAVAPAQGWPGTGDHAYWSVLFLWWSASALRWAYTWNRSQLEQEQRLLFRHLGRD